MKTQYQAWRENLLLALDTLRTHKFRSFLTVLGVLIGTMTVISVAAIIAGLNARLVDTAEQFGTRTLLVYKLQFGFRLRLTKEERLRKPLSYEDAMALKEQCPAAEDVSVAIFKQLAEFGLPPTSVRYKGKEMSDSQFCGCTYNHLKNVNAPLADGRFFTQADDLHRRDVCVIAKDVTDRLFIHEDPLGKSILIDGHAFEVIGTLDKFKAFVGDNPDDRDVLIPYWTYKKYYPDAKDNFISVIARRGQLDEAIDEVRGVLRRRRHVKPADPDNFGITTSESLISDFQQVIGTVVIVMVVISSIGLLVGGIGVMNIMLMSVTERTREIGVRKAIGARRGDITWQFLLEAMTLTGMGGLIAILLVSGIVLLIRELTTWQPAVPIWAGVVGMAVSITIGLVFGVWPAMKAAKLDPVEALRYE